MIVTILNIVKKDIYKDVTTSIGKDKKLILVISVFCYPIRTINPF